MKQLLQLLRFYIEKIIELKFNLLKILNKSIIQPFVILNYEIIWKKKTKTKNVYYH